jgi:hypothetical protein
MTHAEEGFIPAVIFILKSIASAVEMTYNQQRF